jgi:cytosine/creatinine deaminase
LGHDLLIRNGRPNGGARADVLIMNGRISAIGPDLTVPAGVPAEDAHGDLVLPGLVEAHTHLDKTLWGMKWHTNTLGPRLIDKIDGERALKRRLDIDPARQSARQVALSASHGTTHILSHVDIDTDHGLWGLEGVMATREAYRDLADIEIVAFPQSGLMCRPGTFELMAAAMAAGAEYVGGIDPYGLDRDPKGHLDAVFGLAQKYARPIDIHLHEHGTMGAMSMDLIFERTRALGMRGKVTISHAFCLGSGDRNLVDPLIEALAELDIAIMTTGMAQFTSPPVKRLIQLGIRVCSGSDGVRDTWKHYGNADMLERAMFVGMRNSFTRDEDVELAFRVCTQGGADVMRIANYGLAVGCDADLFVVPGDTISHAVVARPPRRLVVKRGKVTARNGVCARNAP